MMSIEPFSDTAEVDLTRCLIERHGNFKLLVRDTESLSFAQTHFPSSNPELCPDSALMLGRLALPVAAVRDIVFLRRTDKEQTAQWQPAIAEAAKCHDMEVVDWLHESLRLMPHGPGMIRRLGNMSGRSHPRLEAAWIASANQLATARLQRGVAILARAYPGHADGQTAGCPRQQLRQSEFLRQGVDWRALLLPSRRRAGYRDRPGGSAGSFGRRPASGRRVCNPISATSVRPGARRLAGTARLTCFPARILRAAAPICCCGRSSGPRGTNPVRQVRLVPVRPLSDVLADTVSPGTVIDLMTVDAEGFDLEVLHTNDWTRFAPRLLLDALLALKERQR